MTLARFGARSRLARRLSWLAVLSLLSAALLVPSTSSALAAAPGNNGTVKIEDSVDPKEEPANDPHVCQFDIKFFFADPAQSGDWRIESWPPTGDGTVVLSGTYDTNGDGFDRQPAEGYYSLPDGHYKLYWRGDEENLWKHKVFWVECQPEEPEPTETPDDDPDPTPTPRPTETPDDDPDPTPKPTETPDEDEDEASILIAKLDDKGTASDADDELLDGARFSVYADDGDEVFDAGDELVFGPAEADGGLLDTDLLAEGMYWIVESTVPSGYEGSDPILVELNVDPSETCIWDAGGLIECVSNEDEESELSLTIVIVTNSPETRSQPTPDGNVGGSTGKPAASARATLPATDTLGTASSAAGGDGWRILLVAMAGVVTATLMLTPARAVVRREDDAR